MVYKKQEGTHFATISLFYKRELISQRFPSFIKTLTMKKNSSVFS